MRSHLLRGALASVLALGLLLGTPLASSASPTGKERRLLKLVNRARAKRDLPWLKARESVRKKSHRHSVKMGEAGTIFHVDCLICLLPDGFSTIGENVAMAPTIREAHRALMRSAPHRHNLLNRDFRVAGFGVVKRGVYFFVTQRFLG
jgi:uncharacterized protein YkwD